MQIDTNQNSRDEEETGNHRCESRIYKSNTNFKSVGQSLP